MKKQLIAGIILFAAIQTSEAALVGTELSLETIFQTTATGPIDALSFATTATVVEPGIEFPNVADLEVNNPPFGLRLVDVSINAGDFFIEIDFDNVTGFNSFASGFQNTYVFTFESDVALSITNAIIDTNVTTLGLASSDVTFAGEQLFINVESLSFNTSTFARINLSVEGGPNPVPLPGAVWLFGSGLLGIFGIRKTKKTA